MSGQLAELLLVGVIALVAAVVGVRLGIVVLAPRIGRTLDRDKTDEETRDRRD